MKRFCIAAALALAACVPASAATTTTFTVTVTPAILSVALSNTTSTGVPGSIVGAISLTWNGTPGTYSTPLVLGGADAAKFALSNGGVVPCNLVVGSTNLAQGSYAITLTAP